MKLKLSLKSSVVENCSLLSHLKSHTTPLNEKMVGATAPQGDIENSNLSITLSRESSESRVTTMQKIRASEPRLSLGLHTPNSLSPRT